MQDAGLRWIVLTPRLHRSFPQVMTGYIPGGAKPDPVDAEAFRRSTSRAVELWPKSERLAHARYFQSHSPD
jgi:hypothetical protein